MKLARTFGVALSTVALVWTIALPAVAASASKDTICHYNSGSKTYSLVTVKGGLSSAAHKGHVNDKLAVDGSCVA